MPPTTDITIRAASPTDLEPLVAFLARCSSTTVYRRFHGTATRPVRRELDRIASPTSRHRSWVATGPDGQVHGTATLAWSRTGAAEVAFWVEDAWFRRGIGRALFGALASDAAVAGVPTVVATIQADNQRAIDFLHALASGIRTHLAGAELVASIPIPVAASSRRAPDQVAA